MLVSYPESLVNKTSVFSPLDPTDSGWLDDLLPYTKTQEVSVKPEPDYDSKPTDGVDFVNVAALESNLVDILPVDPAIVEDTPSSIEVEYLPVPPVKSPSKSSSGKRKRSAVKSEALKEEEEEDIDGSSYKDLPSSECTDQELKRLKRLARNRLSAQKSRQKKKKKLDELEKNMHKTEKVNAYLRERVHQLELENAKLRGCNCCGECLSQKLPLTAIPSSPIFNESSSPLSTSSSPEDAFLDI